MSTPLQELTALVEALRAETTEQSITPERMGAILQRMIDVLPTVSDTNSLKGWVAISSTNELPSSPSPAQQALAYLLDTTLFVYVGSGGDTLDGKYKSAQLKGAPGATGPAGQDGTNGRDGVNLGAVAIADNLETDDATEVLSARQGKKIGDIVGVEKDTFTWVSRRKIYTNGNWGLTDGVRSTQPFSVKAGSTIHATGSGTGFGVISKYIQSTDKYQPLAIMNSAEIQEYTVTVEEDMQVAVSGASSGDGMIQAYVEHAGSILKKVLTPYNTKLYTKEVIPASLSGTAIKMNIGDILCVVSPNYNVDIVKHVTSDGTQVKVMWRPTAVHGYDMYKYEKMETDGIDYISVNILFNAGFAYAYILRRKPTINVLSDDIYNPEYDTCDVQNGEQLSGASFITKTGAIAVDSGNRFKSFKIPNNGYKSVYVRTTNAGYDDYTIGFYSGEPSAATFIPIYSKHMGEYNTNYDSGPYEYKAIVPEGTEFIVVCFRIGTTNLDFRLYKDYIIPQDNDIRETFDNHYSEHLLPMLYQHNSPEYLESSRGDFSDYKKVDLKLLFYTDLHGFTESLNRIMMLGDYLKEKGYLDCIIAGGDNLQQATDSYDWFNNTLSQSKVDNLVAVGNHDASTRWSGTKQLAYTNNIAPVLSRVEDIVAPEDSATEYRMYYYKDYNKVRVIVLYTPPTGDSAFADDSQLTWLQSVLADAKTNSKHVLIVNHHYYNAAYNWNYGSIANFWASNPNTFLSPKGKVGGSDSSFILPNDYLLAVKAFEDSGGKFICWLTGHGHFDNFFDVEDHATYGYQPMFNSASCALKYSANEFIKKRGTKSMDLLTYITVDTVKTTINFLRIGCNIDVWGRSRKVLVYDYVAHSIVSNY